MADFDPDSYIAGKVQNFDPDAYLANSGPSENPSLLDQATSGLKQVGKATVDELPVLGGIAGGILGTPADFIAGPAGNAAGAGIGGYLGQAAKNAINSYISPEEAPKNVVDAITSPVGEGIKQAEYQTGGELAGKAVSAAASYAIPKAVSLFGGVSKDVISDYLENSDRINSSQTIDQLKDISDHYVGSLANDLSDKNINVDQAQDAFKALNTDLVNKYQTMGYDARSAVQSAQQTLKDAQNSNLQNLSGDIFNVIKKLKSDVITGSSNALETLNNSNSTVDLSPVYDQIYSTIDKLQSAGTDESLALADKLDTYKSRLMNQNWGNIDSTDAKSLIKGLDDITGYDRNAGAFDEAKNAAFKGIRSSLDQSLKLAVPQYAEAMTPVAAKAGLLNNVQDFGDKQTAAGLLSRINAPTQMDNRAALSQLGQQYGRDFVGAAQPENLPEYGLLQKAQNNLSNLRPDIVKQKIADQLAASPENAQLQSAQQAQQQAQQKLNPFKPLAPNVAGQTSAQQKLLQLAKGKNIELENMFGELGKMTNTDFVQATHDQNILSAFNKGAANGSRRTVLGSVVGYALGGVGGAGIGAQIGFASDYYGPSVTKAILDGAIKVSKSPTIRTVMGLDLPADIKHKMITGLYNYMGQNTPGIGQ